MSLVELKQAAKGRRIKQYYIMKRHQLIHLLSMPALPESYRLEKLTIHELREQAREKGLRGFWGLHRDELMALLYPDNRLSPQNEENASQHESPHNKDAHEVGREVL